MKREIHPIKEGVCNLCETRIWTEDKPRRPNSNYADFSMVLSDGSVATHALCKSCVVKLTEEDVSFLLECIKQSWKYALVGSATDAQFKKIDELKADAFHYNNREAHLLAKQVKIQKHIDKLKKVKKNK